MVARQSVPRIKNIHYYMDQLNQKMDLNIQCIIVDFIHDQLIKRNLENKNIRRENKERGNRRKLPQLDNLPTFLWCDSAVVFVNLFYFLI